MIKLQTDYIGFINACFQIKEIIMVYKHTALRLAIAFLAKQQNISFSRLAIKSGLDATALNQSKWFSPYGKRRWLSTGSLFQILRTSGVSAVEFFMIMERIEEQLHRIAADMGENVILSLYDKSHTFYEIESICFEKFASDIQHA